MQAPDATAPKLKISKVKDFLRHGEDEVTIRYDPKDVVNLKSNCRYYGEGGPEGAVLLRKVEVKAGDGWKPYPSVSWIDGEGDLELYTCTIIQDPDGSFSIKASPLGVPDGLLIEEAKRVGIETHGIMWRLDSSS